FSTRSGIITNEFALKWYQMKSALLRRSQSAAFIRFSMNVPPGEDDSSREDLVRFAEAIFPYIETALKGSDAAGNSRIATNHDEAFCQTTYPKSQTAGAGK
ncbi:MAG: exosortase-associated EpsI family protein, partial [Candidatus Krumholzibacteria bacterium]|nr:exosortase-associated EpsI family protein [Candidatus Krumholzibacteria bacterium]